MNSRNYVKALICPFVITYSIHVDVWVMFQIRRFEEKKIADVLYATLISTYSPMEFVAVTAAAGKIYVTIALKSFCILLTRTDCIVLYKKKINS